MEPPDPRRSTFLFATGKKGEGKSHLCRAWFDAYPYDRLVIDPTGDVAEDLRAEGAEGLIELDPAALPVRFPRGSEGQRVTLVMVPDMGAATALDDMDRAVGLALDGKDHPVMLWVDEVGRLTPSAQTAGPNTRRLLHHGRHHAVTLLAAGPRPIDVNPLFINQADIAVTFRLPNPADRDRVARNIGFDPAEFGQLNLRHCRSGSHNYLMYTAADDTLYLMPPLPARRRWREAYEPLPDYAGPGP